MSSGREEPGSVSAAAGRSCLSAVLVSWGGGSCAFPPFQLLQLNQNIHQGFPNPFCNRKRAALKLSKVSGQKELQNVGTWL